MIFLIWNVVNEFLSSINDKQNFVLVSDEYFYDNGSHVGFYLGVANDEDEDDIDDTDIDIDIGNDVVGIFGDDIGCENVDYFHDTTFIISATKLNSRCRLPFQNVESEHFDILYHGHGHTETLFFRTSCTYSNPIKKCTCAYSLSDRGSRFG